MVYCIIPFKRPKQRRSDLPIMLLVSEPPDSAVLRRGADPEILP